MREKQLIPIIAGMIGSREIPKTARTLGLHKIPNSIGKLNVVRRARQMTDCVWKPAADIPRAMMETADSYGLSNKTIYQNEFTSGKEYKGLPYSSGTTTFIGTRISLDAFLTSVANPNSVESLESTESSTGGSYYGVTCTAFTAYCLNMAAVASSDYSRIPGMRFQYALITDGVRHSIDGIDIGDILQIDGHCAIITDVCYDGDNVCKVEISEATRMGCLNMSTVGGLFGSVCRRMYMTVDEFFTWFDGFSIYRYDYVDLVPYYPNQYIPIGDEGNSYENNVDLPILPYNGNRCAVTTYSSNTVKLLLNDDTSGYTDVEVYKNGELSTTLPIGDETYVSVACGTVEAKFTARMVKYNENGQVAIASKSCEWYAAPYATPTHSYDSASGKTSFSVTFKYDVFAPAYVKDAAQSGNIPYCVFDYTKTHNPNGTYTYTWNIDHNFTGSMRLGYTSIRYGTRELSFS